MNTTLNTKYSLLQVSSALKIQPSSYGAETLVSPVNTTGSTPFTKSEFPKSKLISPNPITLQQGVKSREFTSLKTTQFVEPVMEKKRYNTPFAQFICKDVKGYYNLRLGPKIYLVKVSLNYTPDFDTEFFGGAKANPFNWHSILVKETPDSMPRPITEDELAVSWLKSNVKKLVNYQRAIKRSANTQTPRYSKEQRINYRNSQYNRA